MGNAQFPFAFGSILKGLQAEFDLEDNSPPNIPYNQRASRNRHRNRGYALEEVDHLGNSTLVYV